MVASGTLRAVGFSYAKRERYRREQPSAFPSSMREFVPPHVLQSMSISFVNNFSLEVFVQKNANSSPKSADKRTIQTFVEVLHISSLWPTYKAQN